MKWWQKAPKLTKPEEWKPVEITLSSSDPLYARAEKIWRLLGFANDRLGQVPKLAGYLATYQELDEKAAKLPPTNRG